MALSKLNTLILDIASGMRMAAPQAILAEVLPQQTMLLAEGRQAWLMGFLPWRGEQLPVVDPGVICGHDAQDAATVHRYGVLYALERLPGLNYYAVPLMSIPHPVRVGAEDLGLAVDAVPPCPVVATRTQLEGQTVAVPDFPYLEQLIAQELAID